MPEQLLIVILSACEGSVLCIGRHATVAAGVGCAGPAVAVGDDELDAALERVVGEGARLRLVAARGQRGGHGARGARFEQRRATLAMDTRRGDGCGGVESEVEQ